VQLALAIKNNGSLTRLNLKDNNYKFKGAVRCSRLDTAVHCTLYCALYTALYCTALHCTNDLSFTGICALAEALEGSSTLRSLIRDCSALEKQQEKENWQQRPLAWAELQGAQQNRVV